MSKKQAQKVKPRYTIYLFIGISAAIFSFFAIFILYNFYFSNKVFPNIYLGNNNLGGLTVNEAFGQTNIEYDSFLGSKLDFIVNDAIISTNIEEWGLTLNTEETTRNLYQAGRSGNVIRDSYFRLRTLIAHSAVEPVYRIDSFKFAAKLDQTFAKHSKEALDATLVFANGAAQVSEEADGLSVDESKLIEDFKIDISDLESNPISVAFVHESPKVNSANLLRLQEKINVLTNQEILLNFGPDNWILSNAKLFDMFKFYPVGYEDNNLVNLDIGNHKLYVLSLKSEPSEPLTLSIHLDDQKLNSYVSGISEVIDKPAIDATLKFENGKVSQFTPAQDGQILNRKLLSRKLGEVLSVDSEVYDKQISIVLPVVITRAKIANEEINSLGIRELVGKGVSYYAHSIPNRIWNVGLGTSRISGTLLKPGDIFSFNRAVGEVSGATGYRQAYVISEGKTVLDDGGGICQVSTTVFRAALNAGLPIITRTAHAYRVGYYEQNGTKPGFDATVFSPSVDFQFKNDTTNSLLVQATVDEKLARLEVDIYGTRDGRRVEIGDSIVSNQIPALPDKRQDDPTLPVGQVKQVDFAAAGATAVFTRKVYRGNDLILNDVFKSVYRPWAAVYLVGTKG